MKNFLKITLSVFAGLFMLTGCNEITTEGVTRVTYYPVLTVVGGTENAHAQGTPYVDPGCAAILNGEDVASGLVIDGTVDPNTAGVYEIAYSYTNVDGFSSTVVRKVVVASDTQLLPNLEKAYNVTVKRDASTAASMGYPQPYPGSLTHIIGDTYWISDLISGWYQSRFSVENPALVPKTNCLGVITIVGTDVILVKAYSDNYWFTTPVKTGATDVIGSYDSVTGVISISTSWSSFVFNGVYTPVL